MLACSGTFQQLFTYVIFSGWIFYALAAASIFVYRRRVPKAACPYRVPGYPWTPALFILAAGALVANTNREGATRRSRRTRHCLARLARVLYVALAQ